MDFGIESLPRATAIAESTAAAVRTAAETDEAISEFGIASSPSAPRAASALGESARA